MPQPTKTRDVAPVDAAEAVVILSTAGAVLLFFAAITLIAGYGLLAFLGPHRWPSSPPFS